MYKGGTLHIKLECTKVGPYTLFRFCRGTRTGNGILWDDLKAPCVNTFTTDSATEALNDQIILIAISYLVNLIKEINYLWTICADQSLHIEGLMLAIPITYQSNFLFVICRIMLGTCWLENAG